MKNSIVSLLGHAFKSLIIPAAFACFALVAVTPAQATETPKETPVAVKYLGSVDNQPVFHVAVDNAEGEEMSILLKDKEGNVIYTERFSDKKFSRKLQLNPEASEAELILTLTSRTTKKTQVFQINKSTRVVEDVIVSQVR